MNRRVGFFLIAALVCAALIPVVDEKFRWVPTGVAVVYAILAVLAALDAFGRRDL